MITAWYCEVCGTIEQKDQTTCPNCGMHKGFLKPIHVDTQNIPTTARILIIGNGVAGFSAAKTLRTLHCTCPITIFSKGNHTPYNYVKLDKEYLLDMDATSLMDTSWYEQNDVNLQHMEITRIDTQKRKVCSASQSYPYDILILAMGCERVLPTIPGNDLAQIYTIDDVYDIHVLRKIMKPTRHGVIIGSDIASIELATALADAHIQVDLIETLPHVMPQDINMIGSELVSTYLKTQKIQLHTNCKIKEFHGISRIESIELESGKCINADFVILSGTLKANLSLIKDSAIEYDKRILIDEHMRTNIPNIYACGGVAHALLANENSYLHARTQGLLAAIDILHIPHFPQHMSLRYFKHDDFSLFLLGDIHNYDQHIERFDDLKKTYELFCYNEGNCSGVLLINTDAQIEQALTHYNDQHSFYSEH